MNQPDEMIFMESYHVVVCGDTSSIALHTQSPRLESHDFIADDSGVLAVILRAGIETDRLDEVVDDLAWIAVASMLQDECDAN